MTQTEKRRVGYRCPECGSEAVGYDAQSEWDAARQVWVLGPCFDQFHCADCGEVDPLEEFDLCPDAWHVGELPGDDGRTVRDANGLTVQVCATAGEACALVATHNAAEGVPTDDNGGDDGQA